MRHTTRQTRENRTITVDFQNEATYYQLLGDGKAFVECVLAFVLSLGFQLRHKATCQGGGCLTRHSHYLRVRLGDVTIWRIQCTTCRTVFTVLPHFILRYRQMHRGSPHRLTGDAWGAEFGAVCGDWAYLADGALSPDLCLRPPQSGDDADAVWTPLASYFLADEKHSHCLTDKVYLPAIVSGRIIWHLGYTKDASARAFTESYQEFQRAAVQQEPAYRVRDILIDGFDSTTKSMRTLFPGVRLGNCLRHALNKLPGKLMAIPSPMRKALRSQFHTLLYRVRQRKGLRVFAFGQRLRRFADHVTTITGTANGQRVRQWFQDKKAGWYAVLADPQMPVTRAPCWIKLITPSTGSCS